jgi:hypothetical protein
LENAVHGSDSDENAAIEGAILQERAVLILALYFFLCSVKLTELVIGKTYKNPSILTNLTGFF